MATRKSTAIKLDPEPSKDDLCDLLDTTQYRLIGLVGITQALSHADCDFPVEAFAAVHHALDDIAGDIYPVIHAYRKLKEDAA